MKKIVKVEWIFLLNMKKIVKVEWIFLLNMNKFVEVEWIFLSNFQTNRQPYLREMLNVNQWKNMQKSLNGLAAFNHAVMKKKKQTHALFLIVWYIIDFYPSILENQASLSLQIYITHAKMKFQ
jgi:hypothetical protein